MLYATSHMYIVVESFKQGKLIMQQPSFYNHLLLNSLPETPRFPGSDDFHAFIQ